MDLPTLLTLLREKDVRLRVEDGTLKASMPPGALTEELKAAVQHHRPALVEHFTGANQSLLPPVLPAGEPAALSVGQASLWDRHQQSPLGYFYNIPRALRITGKLDADRLEAALKAVVRRHEVLRTSISGQKGAWIQALQPEDAFHLESANLGDGLEPEAEVQRWIDRIARRTFPLETGPLIQAILIRVAADRHVLIVNAHHLAADCWSLGHAHQSASRPGELWHAGVFFKELFKRYHGNGDPSLTDPLQDGSGLLQYADFSAWQHQLLATPAFDGQRRYWTDRLMPPPVESLFGPLADSGRYKGRRIAFEVPSWAAELVPGAARRLQTTPHIFLLAMFKVLLLRWKGVQDIIVGSPVPNRARPELHDLVGSFGNNLLYRTRLSEDLTLAQAVRRVRQTVVEAHDHQDYPVESLQSALPAQATRVEARFMMQTPRHSTDMDGGLTVQPIAIDRGVAKYPLSVTLVEQPGGVSGWGEFLDSCLEEATFRALMEGYFHYIRTGSGNPDTLLGSFPALTLP